MKLSKRNVLIISFMLFSLFFGAGNLIFPPFLGQNAGIQTPWAILGFLTTAVVLPVLGVIVVSQFDGLDKLGQNVGRDFYPGLSDHLHRFDQLHFPVLLHPVPQGLLPQVGGGHRGVLIPYL